MPAHLESDADVAAGGLDRITAADAHALLERLAGSPLIDRGAVTVISVDAIRARTGERWPRRRDDVWAYVERKCDEHLSAQDVRYRVSESDYLIAVTTDEGIAAQAVSLKILEEVLFFFLGSAEPADISVSMVKSVERDTLVTTKVDLGKLTAARDRSALGVTHQVDPKETRRRTPISFVTAAGQRVRIDFGVEQVINLQHGLISAVRVQPTVRFTATGALIPVRAFPHLADEDIAFIDRSTLDFGSLFLPKNPQTDPPIIVPVSFRTMGGRKGRSALVNIEGAGAEKVRKGVMVELVDIDLGTPVARLAEVTSLVGQLCRSVLARITPMRDPLAPLRGIRLQGITFDARELGIDDPRLAALLRQLGAMTRGKAPALIAQGLPGESWIERVKGCGFTHSSVCAGTLTHESEVA